ncbi:bifunctional DNA polymerase III subunit alpha [Candidatus Uzinura diaspidicola str. ASNER]|uniref:DNA polymerase III subunit alpha n=1 Tax=Candidatus Uzinura diaspidicola str. ASNER TaxID=1133592 RepID=L7VN51_9FLAO|nr:bifunctional DNA polymerase III subunit alpha [Candidatus Uzinura diaspidicola str. ASNER]
MSAVGITDYGNMMGAFSFLNTIETYNQNILNTCNKLKGVIGCELFVSVDSSKKPLTKNQQDQRWKQVFLAKNKNGYHNLVKLCSEGYINGYSSGFPRVEKELILQYQKDLIALTGDLSAEIPYTILNYGKRRAEEVFKWWHEKFSGDFYVELLRHGLKEQNYVNKVLLQFSQKYGVKYIPQNNTFYLEKKDANAHDILLCVRDGEKQSAQIGIGRGYRFGFSRQEYYFKTQDQMMTSFSDVPESFDYLDELMEKISIFSLSREILLPKFSIPKEFQSSGSLEDGGKRGENSYLYHLAFQGAYQHYGAISPSIKERLVFELSTIEKTRFPGYFLIVQNFVSEARRMGVSVGPGRGSVAGSLVAYCVGITQIDPIQYNLLFERFLNTDRVSLPDIDLDLDDRGRESIVKWVVNKYGNKQVAKIITYGMMAAKSSIRDTARVLDLSLENADSIAKMMPEGVSLKNLLSMNVTQLRKKFYGHDLENGVKLLLIAKDNLLEGKVLRQACILEGLLRCIGVHACGVIITPSDITNYIPIAISKDSDLLLTQFDNNVVESAGLLKIDLLGLKTLTIINDTVELVEKRHGLIIHEYPLDDLKTYQVFQKGETIAIFQYESIGMQRYLRKLKPDSFEDLIAMNALYRPGPIQYIPNFIARKHGKEPIVYVLPEMKEFLSSTYGITVYQEQVMLLAQKLAGFTKGQADILRKAMGKKQKHILDKIKSKFIYGAVRKGFPKNILEKIWKDWETFASYAFNKSHSTCYAYLAFQTAYLKTHYTYEFMAAVLSNHIHNIKDISFFMAECRRLGLSVIGPDINESQQLFLVNEKGNIRFGFKAIKGIGEAVVDSIIRERSKNGPYKSVLDLIKRIDSHIINKKSIESLVLSGAFDRFEPIHRAQYFYKERGYNMIEKIILKKKKKAPLFYDRDFFFPYCNPWLNIVKLEKEKQTVGIYISSHPLYDYRLEIYAIHGISLEDFNRNEDLWIGKSSVFLYGMVLRSESKMSIKKGKKDGFFTLEDYKNIRDFYIFGDAYMKFSHLLTANTFLAIKVFLDRYKNGVIRINFLQILHLGEVFNLLNKELHIEIEVYKLDHKMIDYIENTISKYKGNGTLKIFLLDRKENICMPSRKYDVHLDKRLFMELEKIQGLNLQLK